MDILLMLSPFGRMAEKRSLKNLIHKSSLIIILRQLVQAVVMFLSKNQYFFLKSF